MKCYIKTEQSNMAYQLSMWPESKEHVGYERDLAEFEKWRRFAQERKKKKHVEKVFEVTRCRQSDESRPFVISIRPNDNGQLRVIWHIHDVSAFEIIFSFVFHHWKHDTFQRTNVFEFIDDREICQKPSTIRTKYFESFYRTVIDQSKFPELKQVIFHFTPRVFVAKRYNNSRGFMMNFVFLKDLGSCYVDFIFKYSSVDLRLAQFGPYHFKERAKQFLSGKIDHFEWNAPNENEANGITHVGGTEPWRGWAVTIHNKKLLELFSEILADDRSDSLNIVDFNHQFLANNCKEIIDTIVSVSKSKKNKFYSVEWHQKQTARYCIPVPVYKCMIRLVSDLNASRLVFNIRADRAIFGGSKVYVIDKLMADALKSCTVESLRLSDDFAHIDRMVNTYNVLSKHSVIYSFGICGTSVFESVRQFKNMLEFLEASPKLSQLDIDFTDDWEAITQHAIQLLQYRISCGYDQTSIEEIAAELKILTAFDHYVSPDGTIVRQRGNSS